MSQLMTNKELADLDVFEAITRIRNGEWNTAEVLAWQNAVRVVSYAEGYAEGKAASKPGIELSDWMPDPENPHCFMRIIKGGNPLEIRDRVAFIEKTPRVRTQKFTSTLRDYDKWDYGPSGCAPDYGTWQPSRDWCDTQLRALGYIF